jgi:hypothetical protein
MSAVSVAELSPRLSLRRAKKRFQSQHQPNRPIREVTGREGFTKKIEDGREADFRFSKPLYAALWKSSIWRIQLVSGFHLGKIWATISKLLILNG